MWGIDVNFGDPIWPKPQLVELPRIVPLGQPPITLLGYSLTMVLAEKIVTAIDRGEGNTRWRDFADIYTLARLHSVEAETPGARWKLWQFTEASPLDRSCRHSRRCPLVLNDIARFSDPMLQGTVKGSWDVVEQSWVKSDRLGEVPGVGAGGGVESSR